MCYRAHRWKIKARVASKSDIRHFNTARGEGKLFSVVLSDESGQIKATGFSDSVDQLYDRLVVGEVFFISRAKVQLAKKQYNTLPHDYEIVFENMTEVDEVSPIHSFCLCHITSQCSICSILAFLTVR